MSKLKETFPVELAEDAINNKISNKPAFQWWFLYDIRKKDCIIKKTKSKIGKDPTNMGYISLSPLKMPLPLMKKIEISFGWKP